MKYLILYSSYYGATKQIAQWIKERLDIDKKEVMCYNVKDFDKIQKTSYDVVVLASPLYSGKATDEFYSFLKNSFQKLVFKKLVIVGVAMQKKACFDENHQLRFLSDYKDIREKASVQEVLLGELVFDRLNKEFQEKLFAFYKSMNLDEKQFKNMLSPRTLLNKKDVWDFAQKI